MLAVIKKAVVGLGLIGLSSASASELRFSMRGYAELRYFSYLGAEADPTELDVRFRPRLRLSFGNGGIVFEPEARYAIGRNQERFDAVEDAPGIERLYAEFNFEAVDVVLGKQALNWGSGLLFNPTDLFDDVHLRDVWAEQSGHSAVKVLVPLNPTSTFTVIAGTDDPLTNVLGALRFQGNWGTTDLALTASHNPFRESNELGIDLKGEKTVGLWVEAAWIDPWDHHGYLEMVTGVDYTFGFRNGLYLAAQYYRDGSGASTEAEYDLAGLILGQRATLARDYMTLTGRLAWSEDLSIGTQSVYNAVDGTGLLTTFADWTRIPSITVSVGATWLAGGSEGEFRPPPTLDPNGLVPDAIAYIWLRYHL